MGKFLRHEPCDKCGSSDAKALYEDGSGFCWKCEAYFHPDGKDVEPENHAVPSLPGSLWHGEYLALPKRGISAETCQKFGYHCMPDGQVANYHDVKGHLIAQKVRSMDKSFRWLGSAREAALFGMHLWAAGGKRIVITEGEIDAMSLSQAQNNSWPVVSVKNGAQGAKAELTQHLEYLESFGEVVLLFDMDEPGRAAAIKCAELFTPGKCKIGQIPLKDANEMLQAGRLRELVSAVWQAKAYRPDGLIEGADLWSEVVREPEPGLVYPWPCLSKLHVELRARELVCITGGTGIGKTQILREIAFHLVAVHQQRVGYISLEESSRDVAIGQMSLAALCRLHLPEVRARVSESALRAWFEQTLGTGRYLLCDPKWVAPEQILARMRFMVVGGGCRWILFDHISMTVGGDASAGDERKRIDELMYKMRALVDELGFGVVFVTHLRKKDGTPYEEGGRVSLVDFRGSGAIAQVTNTAIAAERNQQATDIDRNRTVLRVLKNRFGGETAIAGEVLFQPDTGRMVEVDPVIEAIARSVVREEYGARSDF